MNREAVEYVKDAEKRAAQFHEDGKIEIKKIESRLNEELAVVQQQLEKELEQYEQEQRSQYEEKLSIVREEAEQAVSVESERFAKVYQERREDVAKLIAKEVLRRYGYRQDEKVDAVGGTVQ